MKNTFLFTFTFFAWTLTASAQSVVVRDSLLKKLNALPVTANDTTRVNVLNALAFEYYLNKPDTTYLLAQQAYEFSRRLTYPAGQARALVVMSIAFFQLGDYSKGLKRLNEVRSTLHGYDPAGYTSTYPLQPGLYDLDLVLYDGTYLHATSAILVE